MRLRHHFVPLTASILSILMMAGISGCAALSNYPPPEQGQPAANAAVATLTAQKIILVDASGHQRGQLGVAQGGLGLALSDASGKPRIAMIVDDTDRPGLTLYGANGMPRASVQLSQNGDSGVALYDDAGRCHVAMAVSSAGVPTVTQFDPAGNPEIPALRSK